MAEASISILIVGTMLVSALSALGAAARTELHMAQRGKAIFLAEDLMAEILQMPYEDPDDPTILIGREGSENAATRVDFDDVDDYDNWSSAPQDRAGAAILGAENYTLEVDGERNTDAAWYYPDPSDAARQIKDHVAFWRGVQIIE